MASKAFGRIISPGNAPAVSLSMKIQARTFAATTYSLKAHGALPTFSPTTSSELDAALNSIREDLFIPAHMLRTHRNLVYRFKGHRILNEEPLTIELGGAQVPLVPKKALVAPCAWRFTKALNLMKAPADLDAIPGLVEGFYQAKRPLSKKHLEKLSRFLNLHGRVDLTMMIARQAKRLGFRFNKSIAREFMRGLRIQQGLPTIKDALKALRDSRRLFDILADPAVKFDPKERLRRDPAVAGTILSIFADTYIRFGGVDRNGNTARFVGRLKNCWEDVEWERDFLEGDKKSVHEAKYAILDYTPVLEGILEAKQLLKGTEHEEWLVTEGNRLAEAIAGWTAYFEGNKHLLASKGERLGVETYRQVTDRIVEDRKAKAREKEEEEEEEDGGEAYIPEDDGVDIWQSDKA